MANKNYSYKITPVYYRKSARLSMKSRIGSNKIQRVWASFQLKKFRELLRTLKAIFKITPSKAGKFQIKRIKTYLVLRTKHS